MEQIQILQESITRILSDIAQGKASSDELIAAVYTELREMAQAKVRHERPDHTLGATALVHEAWLRIGDPGSFESRRHFFGAAANAMRRILIDNARAKGAAKRGGPDRIQVELGDPLIPSPEQNEKIDSLLEAFDRFESQWPAKAELVRLRYFIGLTTKEAAEVLGISTATADRHWAFAKAWLQTELDS